MYAAKELCRRMSGPTEKDWQALKRLGRYLKGKPKLVQIFEWERTDRSWRWMLIPITQAAPGPESLRREDAYCEAVTA